MKILIAEDQAPSALFLRRALEKLGYEVSTARDGEDAWRQAGASTFPVVISDWVMPEMDGLDLCRRIRARTGGPYTYVILLTSKDRRRDRLEGLRAGADDFLTKPTDPEELAVRLEIARRILAVHEELRRQNDRLAELAAYDELTGVKNRRRFREDLEMHFALASRKGDPLSLVMLDVDHFKQFNDAFGHPAGDDVLREVAATLREATRGQDVVARYGGEEFVVLLPSTDGEEALVTAERLRGRIAERGWPLREVTASLGVATTGADVADASALTEAADRALYRAKRAGRNQCRHALEAAYHPAELG